jgi:hypothetical protein
MVVGTSVEATEWIDDVKGVLMHFYCGILNCPKPLNCRRLAHSAKDIAELRIICKNRENMMSYK